MRLRAWSPGWGLALLLSFAALSCLSSATSSHRANAKKMSHAAVMQAAAAGSGTWFVEELLGLRALSELFVGEKGEAFLCSLIGSIIVGLSGIFPLLVIPIEAGAALKTEAGCQKLKQLLSFAIGGLLGDVFLHLLPEAWAYSCSPGVVSLNDTPSDSRLRITATQGQAVIGKGWMDSNTVFIGLIKMSENIIIEHYFTLH